MLGGILLIGVALAVMLLLIWVLARYAGTRPAYRPPSSAPGGQPSKPFVYPNAFDSAPRSPTRVREWKSSAVSPTATPRQQPRLEDKLRAIDWYQFEKVVSAIYEVPGCTVERLGGAKADGGVDLLVEEGGRRIVVQCKHWRTWSVGVRHIRELLGAMTIAKADKGVLVTLRGCTADATDLARKQGVDIIDEAGLIKLMQMSDGSVDQKILAFLDDKRKFCPKCESELVVRTAERGPNRGGQFWGCSNYPRCRYILRDG